MKSNCANDSNLRDETRFALTIVAHLRRAKRMSILMIPAALNDYGFRTENDQLFTMKTLKQLMNGEIRAIKI